MHKLIRVVAVCLFIALNLSPIVSASEPLNVYLFWGDGCPHCAKEKAYFNEVLPDYPNVKLNLYEIYNNRANIALMQEAAKKLEVDSGGVPFLIIGDKAFVGYSEKISNPLIKNRLDYCSSSKCPDSIASIIAGDQTQPQADQTHNEVLNNSEKNEGEDNKEQKIISLPIFGEINALDFSLPVLTVIIGIIDGFNPCAMWVLLFLISMLLGFQNRAKMWLLGLVFIVASAFVYFLFMAAWLNIILFLGLIFWVRLAIGGLAFVGGGYHLKKAFESKNGGCEVVGSGRRQAVFAKIREIANDKSIILALGGIILLAFAVNLVELVCSAGFPAVYTQVLAMSDLPTWQYYGYILLYIFFFMLDDIVVFVIAMITLRMTGISTKYSKYSNAIGGILMIIIGALLIFKPEWLMFG